MSVENAFAELGLRRGATERDVKAAWRRLASHWHPDRNRSVDALARMQRINQAFEAICNAGFVMPEEATDGASAPAQRDDPHADGPAQAAGEGRGERTADDHRRQPPIVRKIKLTLEEAAAGGIKMVRGRVREACSGCEGAGHQVLGGKCAHCGGSGSLTKRSVFFGWPCGAVECDECHGGGIAQRTCPDCDGAGTVSRKYQLKVRIPAGVVHGDLLQVDCQRAGANRPPADLEIRVELRAHAFFELSEDGTIRCKMPVDGFAWVGNRSIQVPTLAGYRTLALDRDRLVYRLKGQGFPAALRGSPGDQEITVTPVFPQRLSPDQEILLDQLIATQSKDGGTDERLRAWQRNLRAWERGLDAAS